MGNCASTRSPAGGSPADHSAVLHRDAERRMREASQILYPIHQPRVAYFISQTKKVLTNTAKVGSAPPKGQRASACSPAAARTSILTIAALLTGPVAWHWRLWQVDHPQSMSLRVFLAFSPSADGQITPISKCGSSTPSLGPRPRSRAIVR